MTQVHAREPAAAASVKTSKVDQDDEKAPLAEETKELTAPACRVCRFSDIVGNPAGGYTPTLAQLVSSTHRTMAQACGWTNAAPLVPGQYGYDNHIVTLYVVAKWKQDHPSATRVELAEQAHLGWIVNYTHWRDHSPWETDARYKKPFTNSVKTVAREQFAATKYENLSADDQKTDLIIADAVMQAYELCVDCKRAQALCSCG